MPHQQLKDLENKLWEAADQLRANSKLTATEYSFPVLGLIFLRHAYNRFLEAKTKIEKYLPIHAQRGRRAVTKDDFQQAKAIFLPAKSQWSYLASLPESKDIGEEIDEAFVVPAGLFRSVQIGVGLEVDVRGGPGDAGVEIEPEILDEAGRENVDAADHRTEAHLAEEQHDVDPRTEERRLPAGAACIAADVLVSVALVS